MKIILRLLGLYLVPVASILIFLAFTIPGEESNQIAWGAKHGLAPDIANNYPLLNAVTLAGWAATAMMLVLRRYLTAALLAAAATGYVLADIVMFIPMARIAGEPFPFDQFVIVVIQAMYVALLARFAASQLKLNSTDRGQAEAVRRRLAGGRPGPEAVSDAVIPIGGDAARSGH